ncbi:MAG: hypothetical protein Q7T97_07295 [Burkholderiaceae bacterium]|nr:hypothetical protein [Burkholderiaceae bacterium]
MHLASTTDNRLTGPASTRPGKWLVRWMLCLVACCLALQGLTLSAERARGRAHHHLDAFRVAAPPPSAAHAASHLADLDGHRYAPEIASDVVDGQSPQDPSAHDHDSNHSIVAHHDHAPATDGVVYVAEDGGASALNPHPTLARSAHDLDVLMPRFDFAVEANVARRWTDGDPRPVESHVSGPLERPPRA